MTWENVAALVIGFLLKIRFPRNQPISDILRRRYGYSALHGFRKTEQASKRLAKKQLDLQFLECCKVYEVTPRFLKFKLYRRSLHGSELYKDWQRKLLDIEIRAKRKEIKEANLSLSHSFTTLKSIVSRLDFICLTKFIRTNTLTYKKKCKLHLWKIFPPL